MQDATRRKDVQKTDELAAPIIFKLRPICAVFIFVFLDFSVFRAGFFFHIFFLCIKHYREHINWTNLFECIYLAVISLSNMDMFVYVLCCTSSSSAESPLMSFLTTTVWFHVVHNILHGKVVCCPKVLFCSESIISFVHR